MTTEEKIKVMQAFVDGKEIEIMNHKKLLWKIYTPGEPLWDWHMYEYRIRQTQRTHEEIMNNWFNHGNLWCKVKAYNAIDKQYTLTFDGWRDKEYFNDLEMKTDEQMWEMEEE